MNRRQTKKALKQALAKPITLEQAATVIAKELILRGERLAFIDFNTTFPFCSIHNASNEIIAITKVTK